MTVRIILFVTLAFALGCSARDVSNDDGAADDGATTQSTEESSSGGASQSGTAEAGGVSDGGDVSGGDEGETAAPPPSTCADGSDFAATAELIDTGLGPGGADVTLENCTEIEALLFQDCCFGAAFRLQRRDDPGDPWRDTSPDVACDCEGPVEPTVIAPQATFAFMASPSGLDSESICGVGTLEYRFILRAARSDCEDCWQDVPTTAFGWYCEG